MADLANDHKFAKVPSAKILCLILNNIINVQNFKLGLGQMFDGSEV